MEILFKESLTWKTKFTSPSLSVLSFSGTIDVTFGATVSVRTEKSLAEEFPVLGTKAASVQLTLQR